MIKNTLPSIRKNEKLILISCLVAAIVVLIFSTKKIINEKNQAESVLMRETQLNINNAFVNPRRNHLNIIKNLAKEILKKNTLNTDGIKSRIVQINNNKWELRPNSTHSSKQITRITGIGNINELSNALLQEIALCEALNTPFVSTKDNIEHTPFVYYISKRNFWAIYPYYSHKDYIYAAAYQHYEPYQFALPKNNPDKNIYWTAPYIWDAPYEGAPKNGLSVTVGVPLYDKENFLGTICLAMTFENISNYLKTTTFSKNKISLVDNNNQLISNTISLVDRSEIQNTLKELLGKTNVKFQELSKNHHFWRNYNRFYISDIDNAPWVIIHNEPIKEYIIYMSFKLFPVIAVLTFLLILIWFLLRNKRLVIEAKHAKEEADIANKAKSAFLANMSHEIRTPMNAVLGFTEILTSKITDPAHKKHLSSIYTSGKALLGLINDILDISKVEAGMLNLEYSPTSIQHLLDEMKTIFNQKLTDKGLDFIIEIKKNLPESLLLDEVRLRQILINLIGNAIKFTEKGYIKIIITHEYPTKYLHSTLDLQIDVKDTGKGIPKSQQEHIFKEFSQVKGQKISNYGGTGLGLSITQKLLKLMEGTISVSSEEGKGSSFSVKFKNIEVALAPAKNENTKENFSFNTNTVLFNKATILVVDDIDYNREIIINYLEKQPFRILEAENGKIALDLIREELPDIILLDMKMPVMDGYELSRILIKDEKLKNIPVIAVTASAMNEDVKIISKLCDAYLKKPLSKSELYQGILEFLPHKILKTKPIPKKPKETKLTIEQLKKSPGLYEALVMNKERISELKQNINTQHFEQFIADISNLKTQNIDIKPIATWLNELQEDLNNFDIKNLINKLTELENLLTV